MEQFISRQRSSKASHVFIVILIAVTQIEAQAAGNTGSDTGNPHGLPTSTIQDPFYSPYVAPSPDHIYGNQYPHQNIAYNQQPQQPQYTNQYWNQNPSPNYNYQHQYSQPDPNSYYYGNQYQYRQPQQPVTTPPPPTTPPPGNEPGETEDVPQRGIGPDGPVFNPSLLPPAPELGSGIYGFTGDVGTSGNSFGSGKVYSLPTGARSLLERVTQARLHRLRQERRRRQQYYYDGYNQRHNYGMNSMAYDPFLWLAFGGF